MGGEVPTAESATHQQIVGCNMMLTSQLTECNVMVTIYKSIVGMLIGHCELEDSCVELEESGPTLEQIGVEQFISHSPASLMARNGQASSHSQEESCCQLVLH